MATGEARRGARGLGTVCGDRYRSPERKVTRQSPWEGTQATSQGAHGRGETGEAGGSLGCRRGWRGLQVRGRCAQGIPLQRLGSFWAPGSRGYSCACLPSPLPLPSKVPVVEHFLAVWVQGPVIAFACGGRKSLVQKTRGLKGRGVNLRNGGQLWKDSLTGSTQGPLTPPQTVGWLSVPERTGLHRQSRKNLHFPESSEKGVPQEMLRSPKFKYREKAHRCRASGLWSQRFPKRRFICPSSPRGRHFFPVLQKGH